MQDTGHDSGMPVTPGTLGCDPCHNELAVWWAHRGKRAEHPEMQHSTLSVQTCSYYCSNWNVIMTINSMAIGLSFRYVGSYFHFFKASSAAWYRSGGPDTTFISTTFPCSSRMA